MLVAVDNAPVVAPTLGFGEFARLVRDDLQLSTFGTKAHNLPSLPARTRSDPEGDTVITTFNVENCSSSSWE
jgi:hypothetical protein